MAEPSQSQRRFKRARKESPIGSLKTLGFKIHFIVYLAVNALLIVINLLTTPGTYWFYWPLLAWGIGIAGHAFGVLRHTRRSSI